MLEEQVNAVRNITDFEPEIAIVLGSGLGQLAEKVENAILIPYYKIEGMPISTAPSHKGQFVLGMLGGKKVILMQGRVHLYEGYSPQEIVMPIRLMKALGANSLILTNAAGGINKSFNVGDLMMIEDHISCFVPSPLIGKNDEKFGTRFPDMSNAFDKEIQGIIKSVALKNDINLKTGVYAQLTGPQFESPAEIRMLSRLGADAVGMSTVIEDIAANHCGMKVCGISLITNLACGLLDKPLSGEEVNETANKVAPKFEKLITEIVKAI